MRSADDLLRDILRTAHVTGLAREHVEAVEEIRQALLCERCRLSPAERGSLPGMPDVPGSGPPDPDSTARLAEVIAALRAGTDPGVKLSAGITRALLSVVPNRNAIPIGGIDHHLYEAFGVGFLSPAVV